MKRILLIPVLMFVSGLTFGQAVFSDLFNNSTLAFVGADNAWTHSESGEHWRANCAGGHGEWEGFNYTLNNGTINQSYDLSGGTTLWIRAHADTACVLRVDVQDNSTNGPAGGPRVTDAVTGQKNLFELSTSDQSFSVDFAGEFNQQFNCTGGECGLVDSTDIRVVLFMVNPGFFSFPITINSNTYNFSHGNASGGHYVDFDHISIGADVTGVEGGTSLEAAKIYPNPSSGDISVNIALSSSADVNVSILDVVGNQVATVFSGALGAGSHVEQGSVSGLAPGIYIVSYEIDGEAAGTSKLVVE